MKALLAISLGLAVVACAKSKRPGGAQGAAIVAVPSASNGSRPDASAAGESADVQAVVSVDASVPPPKPTGTVTLVIQRVDSRCMVEPGEVRTDFLGHDVLLEIAREGEKKTKAYAFCPTTAPDGGALKPNLNMWEMCRSFPSCKIVPMEAGVVDRAEITCGKEVIVLENDGKRTVLKGSFGEREIAPIPMRIEPAKTAKRIANVDC